MTEEQVDQVVETLCEQLQTAIRLKGTQPETPRPNLKDLGFDPASVRTTLLTGLRAADATVTCPHLSRGPEDDEDDQWWWHFP